MEYFDIRNKDGSLTGEVKERTLVHRDGDIHGTSHVWIVRLDENGHCDLLLQKRSANKDSFPGCYDISSAGYIPAGDDFVESALRELKEELGIDAQPEELEDCGFKRKVVDQIFHGKKFKDNQISKVFKMKRNDLDISKLKLQKEEIESIMWMDFKECVDAVKSNKIKSCIFLDELEMINRK